MMQLLTPEIKHQLALGFWRDFVGDDVLHGVYLLFEVKLVLCMDLYLVRNMCCVSREY